MKNLAVGFYEASENFKTINEHTAVMDEETGLLVAVTGPAYDPESEQYAQLFAAAPALLAACREALDWLNRFGEHSPVAFGGEAELAEQLSAAIAAAGGGE